MSSSSSKCISYICLYFNLLKACNLDTWLYRWSDSKNIKIFLVHLFKHLQNSVSLKLRAYATYC